MDELTTTWPSTPLLNGGPKSADSRCALVLDPGRFSFHQSVHQLGSQVYGAHIMSNRVEHGLSRDARKLSGALDWWYWTRRYVELSETIISGLRFHLLASQVLVRGYNCQSAKTKANCQQSIQKLKISSAAHSICTTSMLHKNNTKQWGTVS